jgi:hypothetical protein
MVQVSREQTPAAANLPRYDCLYDLYTRLIEAASPIWDLAARAGVERWS